MLSAEQSSPYASFPYLAAKLVAELPVSAFFPLAFGSVVYPMTGLHPTLKRFATFCGLITLESFTSSAIGREETRTTHVSYLLTHKHFIYIYIYILFACMYRYTRYTHANLTSPLILSTFLTQNVILICFDIHQVQELCVYIN